MKKVELLAPAKNKETAFAAIDCGADAVYIGACSFGARQNAGNSLEDIKEVVNYAHKFWAKVHVTINTILTDSELEEALNLIRKLENIGVDAIIIQDMGLLERLINENINIPIHMSTQCDNYLPEKVKFFNNIGVNRVILAREMSIDKMKQIHKENPDLELESFIHGALCVSMSGQCYLSRYIGNRSANRGECAQPCRKKYDVIDDKGNIVAKDIYPLCLKDFNGSKYINELIESGICSFKIEGRLKDISYVKNIVAYYRNILGKGISSGKSIYSFVPNPEKSFNRGYTNYFLNGREECFSLDSPKSKGEYLGKVVEVGRESFVIKTSKEIHPQDGLYFNNDGCLVNKICEKKVSAGQNNNLQTVKPNKKVTINIGDDVYRNFDAEFEKELLKPVKRQIGVDIKILKDNDNLLCMLTDEDEVSVSTEIFSSETANNQEKMKETFIKQISKTGELDFYISDIKIDSDIIFPFMPVSSVNELRRNLFEELMDKRIEIYNTKKEHKHTLNHVGYFQSNIDYKGNVHNKFAKLFYEKCGAEVTELSYESKIPNRQIELMRCKHCIKYALNMCKSPLKLSLKDSFGEIYPLKFDCSACEMFVMSR